MSKKIKFLIGFAVALGAGWLAHGPLGQGEAFIAQLEAPIQPLIDVQRVPRVSGHMQRSPYLARTAILTGPADCFQRNGMGSMGGIDARVLTIPGIGRVEWTDMPPEGECR